MGSPHIAYKFQFLFISLSCVFNVDQFLGLFGRFGNVLGSSGVGNLSSGWFRLITKLAQSKLDWTGLQPGAYLGMDEVGGCPGHKIFLSKTY